MNRPLSLLALCASMLLGIVSVVRADPQSDQQRRKALLPQVRATTECITTQVANELAIAAEPNPTIPQMVDRVLRRTLCFPAIRTLIEQHDRLLGPGSGQAFVEGPYLADLPRAVSARLQVNSRGNTDRPSSTALSASPRIADTRVTEALRIAQSQTVVKPVASPVTDKPRQASATVSERLKGIEDDDSFRKGLNLIFVTLAASTVILFVLGFGSRVVVFADAADLFMSACIFVVPLVTLFGAGMIGWMLAPENPPDYATTVDMALDNPAPTFILCVGALAWTWSILGTIVSSIRYNGIIIGPVIAVLKLGALLSLMLAWFGTLHNYDEEGNENHIAAKFFIFALLVWFASKFVNGSRVMERRMERHYRRHSNGTIAVST